ncbi:unnamed protein product, partial [Phaeothamnion confervicola]
DGRQFDKGPFFTFDIPHVRRLAAALWTSVTTSMDGQHMLVSTAGSLILLLDAFEGNLQQAGVGDVGIGSGVDARLSPDGRWVVSGSEDGALRVWDAAEGNLAAMLPAPGQEEGKQVRRVCFSPRFETMATAGSSTALWIAPLPDGPDGQ